MRRLLSILLLLAFALPMAEPAFGLMGKDESQLPMCCRRGGKHHCAGMPGGEAPGSGVRVTAPMEKCPYSPAALVGAIERTVFAPPVAQAIYAGVVAHPAVVAQTESRQRMARERARGKRGPPQAA